MVDIRWAAGNLFKLRWIINLLSPVSVQERINFEMSSFSVVFFSLLFFTLAANSGLVPRFTPVSLVAVVVKLAFLEFSLRWLQRPRTSKRGGAQLSTEYMSFLCPRFVEGEAQTCAPERDAGEMPGCSASAEAMQVAVDGRSRRPVSDSTVVTRLPSKAPRRRPCHWAKGRGDVRG